MAKSLAELQQAFNAQYHTDESKEEVIADLKEDIEVVDEKTVKAVVDSFDAKEVTSVDSTKGIKAEEVENEKAKEVQIENLVEDIKVQDDYKIDTTMVEVIRKEKLNEAEEEKRQGQKNKASVISDIIFYFTLIAMVFCAVLFSRGAFGNQTFGGYKFYEVLTTSMDSVYPRGSLILIKDIEASELVVGDDITFTRDSSNLITHRIVEIKENYESSGQRAFVTKGVDNAAVDKEVVLAGNVVGRVVKGFPGLGAAFSWIGANLWIVLVLFLSLMALSFFLRIFWREQKRQKKIKSND